MSKWNKTIFQRQTRSTESQGRINKRKFRSLLEKLEEKMKFFKRKINKEVTVKI